jgi:hypothetical protein
MYYTKLVISLDDRFGVLAQQNKNGLLDKHSAIQHIL